MYVELGKIVGVWGVKGWVKLHSYTRNRPDIAVYKTWYLSRHKKGPGSDATVQAVDVIQCREQAKGIVAQLDSIVDRDQALAMSGLGIWVKQSDLPKLPDGQFYWQQLIGLTVSNEEAEIGVIKSILETGANDVLVCFSSSRNTEILIPYNDEVVVGVDLEAGSMKVTWDPDFLAE
ncbi:ribosome maturation factor RimM [Arenicella sp. 4NH20-0111]|uniref:ribosome maturation factor RimM n=1 Tax=Arenicella sp. 4NH20-0111 TaxID=3127648 RepID=UPI003105688C